jgi:nicotinamide mononucleotide adenylyltransferase
MIEIYNVASAHGRFQPLHFGHVEYLLAAKQRCRFLYVGVTQYVRSRLEDTFDRAPHRAEPICNPMTFFERQAMIRDVLLECGVPLTEFGVIPFPIEDIAILPEFLPQEVPILTTICEEWNREKVARLRAADYAVEVLYADRERAYSGTEIRRLIMTGDTKWKDLVPLSTIRWIERVGMEQRLLDAAGRSQSVSEHDQID